eukprot:2346078-Prymnesium_polylepis.1
MPEEAAEAWSAATLSHAVSVPQVGDAAFEGSLEAFLCALGLQPLAACVSEGVDVADAPSVHAMARVTSSARAVAIAGVLQRLTATPSTAWPAGEREVLRGRLGGLRLHTANALECYRE